MKKLVAACVGTLVMTGALVSATGPAAVADPYPGTVATKTKATEAPDPVKADKSANVCGKVSVSSGSGTPAGTVTITVKRDKGGFADADSFGYAGGKVCLRTKKLKKAGGYTATVEFDAKKGSVYKDSADEVDFDVKPKPKS
jgi:hypothetical protein